MDAIQNVGCDMMLDDLDLPWLEEKDKAQERPPKDYPKAAGMCEAEY